MSNQSFYLFQLQKIDRRIDQIAARKKEILNQISDRESLDRASKAFDQANNNLSKLEHELSALEWNNKEKRIKIEQSEASLYSGSVKNPKELEDLQKEISSIKKALSALENEQLALMQSIEDIQHQAAQLKKVFDQEQAQFLTKNCHFLGEITTLDNESAKIHLEREAIFKQIDPQSIALYEKLRSIKKGIAVAGIEEQCCQVCGAELTPAECQSAKSSTHIVFCPSCSRILYAG